MPSLFFTTMKCHPWKLPPLGAQVANSTALLNNSSETSSFFHFRIERLLLINFSKVSISISSILSSLIFWITEQVGSLHTPGLLGRAAPSSWKSHVQSTFLL